MISFTWKPQSSSKVDQVDVVCISNEASLVEYVEKELIWGQQFQNSFQIKDNEERGYVYIMRLVEM